MTRMSTFDALTLAQKALLDLIPKADFDDAQEMTAAWATLGEMAANMPKNAIASVLVLRSGPGDENPRGKVIVRIVQGCELVSVRAFEEARRQILGYTPEQLAPDFDIKTDLPGS